MPLYEFEAPDGSVQTFDSPRELTPQEIQQANPFAKAKKVGTLPTSARRQVRAQAAIGEKIHELFTDPEQRQAALKATGEFAKREALPTTGTIVGGMLPVPGGPAVGRFAGGAIGEVANQAFGITEPSIGDVVLSGAAGTLGAGGQRTFKAGARGLAGFAAPSGLRSQGQFVARDALEAAAKKSGAPRARVLYESLSQQAPIPSDAVIDAFEAAVKTAPGPVQKRLQALMGGLFTSTTQRPGGIVLSGPKTVRKPQLTHIEVTEVFQKMRQEARDLRRAGKGNAAADIDKAANQILSETSKISPILAQANAAWRRERSIDTIVKVMRGDNPVKRLEDVFDDKLIFGALNSVERESMRDLAQDVARITSATVAGRFVMPVIEPVAELMTNTRGRRLLKFLLKQPGATAQSIAAAAAQLTRGGLARMNTPEEAQPGSVPIQR